MIVALFAISVVVSILIAKLRRAYTQNSLAELESRARHEDESSHRLILVARYQESINFVAWSLIVLLSSGAVLLSVRTLSVPWAYIFNILFITAIFLLIPNIKSASWWVGIGAYLAPSLKGLLQACQPFSKAFYKKVSRLQLKKSTVLDKQDFLNLLKSSKQREALGLPEINQQAMLALMLSEKSIGEVMLPFDEVRIVSAKESIGPILIDELHKTEQGWFPVKEGRKKSVIGFFYINDLLDYQEGGSIFEVMNPRIYYVKYDQPLWLVLDAFIKTGSRVFLAIDERGKVKGMVSVEEVLVSLLSVSILSDKDGFDDPEQVALY